jgi:hypothetical protein
MKHVKRETFIKTFAFNLRWGQLLERERSKVGISRETLAATFGLDPQQVGRWETGFGSPIASLFYQIIVHLGPEAYRSAAELWFAVQAEQYFAQKAGATRALQVERRPGYLALGAIKDRYKDLAA